MKPFTLQECVSWCEFAGIGVARATEPKPIFPASSACFSIAFPERARGRCSLAIALLNDDVDHPIRFTQALLWTHMWEIGSEELNQIGVAAIEGMRGSRLETHPGLAFEPTEYNAAQAIWAMTTIFEFDASVVLAGGDVILYASHDSQLYVACHSTALRDVLAREYAEFWPVRVDDCPVHMR